MSEDTGMGFRAFTLTVNRKCDSGLSDKDMYWLRRGGCSG